MKKIFILFPILLLLVAGCSLTQKADTSSKEQASDLSSQIQDLKNQNSELLKENQAIKSNPTAQNNISSTTLSQAEEPGNESSETWANSPAEIKDIYVKKGVTYLSLDILSRNPNYAPGVSDFFINQNSKLREVSIDANTKSYNCGAGQDSNETTADVLVPTLDTISNIQKSISGKNGRITYYFDINNNNIGAIYEQCLP